MKKRLSEEQSVRILGEAEVGGAVSELCRRHSISDATFYSGRKKYRGMNAAEVRELKALRAEKGRLKRLLAEALLDRAASKAHSKRGPLAEVGDSLATCFRLLRAYAKGEYTRIPWQSLILLIASGIYFVMPIDLIPDWIVALGYLDDAAVLGWTFKALKADMDEFYKWETQSI